MIDENSKMGVVAVVFFTVAALLFFGLHSPIAPYIILAGTIFLFVAAKGGDIKPPEKGNPLRFEKDRFESLGELDEKEKKLLIFHILSAVEKTNQLDMNEIAQDFDISIYALTDIIKFLSKHELVHVIYPPMQSLPVLREGNSNKSKAFREKIYQLVSKKNLLGMPIKEDFAKEVADYLESRKRKRIDERS